MTLREMRDRANLSCTQVGKKLFVDQSCVRHWEYGDWAPARKYYKKMAKLYGVSEEEIKAARCGGGVGKSNKFSNFFIFVARNRATNPPLACIGEKT